MARKRLIDTEELYFDTELIDLLGPRGLHLYIRLWGLAEDWGGFEPRYDDIALKMGALKFSGDEVKGCLKLLIDAGKIIEYTAAEKQVYWLVNLLKHQPLDNPAPPKLPLPAWIKCKIEQYKSGKKYASYQVIPKKLPVAYRSATGNGVTVTVTKQNSNSNSNETVAADAAPQTPKNPTTPQGELVEAWSGLYRSESGLDYSAGPAEFTLAAGLIKKHGMAAVLEKSEWLFAACKKQKWPGKNGIGDFTIKNLSANWNSLVPATSGISGIESWLRKEEAMANQA
jgi:hypothetical protein